MDPTYQAGLKEIADKLKARMAEVAAVRDRIREDLDTFEALYDECEDAHDSIERAIQSVSYAADRLSELT